MQLQHFVLLLAGDKWNQAKTDAKEGGQKLADAASEAAEAASMKARRAGDHAAGKADELGVSGPVLCDSCSLTPSFSSCGKACSRSWVVDDVAWDPGMSF